MFQFDLLTCSITLDFQHDNCLACTSDMKCGWCASSGSCLSRETRQSNCEQHLTLLPSRCVNCSSHIYCENCVNGGDSPRERGGEQCEWIQVQTLSKSLYLLWFGKQRFFWLRPFSFTLFGFGVCQSYFWILEGPWLMQEVWKQHSACGI